MRYPTAFTLIVLAMGWLILLAYTGGIVFFAADRTRYGHVVWHLCVLLGNACHNVAALRYAG